MNIYTYRYSKKTNSFYPIGIDYADLPDDCIEATEKAYQLAIAARSENKPFEFDADVLIIYDAAPDGFHFFDWNKKIWVLDESLESESVKTENTQKKNELIAYAKERIEIYQDELDLEMADDEEATEAKIKAWKVYRVTLNKVDVTQENIEWPIKPE